MANALDTNEPKTDLGKAILALKNNETRYSTPTKYYAGDHNLSYATDKFRNAFGTLFTTFALNLCPAVVDAVRDKLIVSNFRIEAEGDGQSETLPAAAWKIWQDNRMGKRSGEIHKEACTNGDAYAIVWVDPQKNVTIYPQRAASCTVVYDEETPGKILRAAKYWFTADKKARINLYYPDRIEKWVSKGKLTANALPEESKFEQLEKPMPNPYGVVPVFHFANNTSVGSFGQSELAQAIPVQDALNKSVLDMLVAMEFAAFRQRWATGIEVELDDNGEAKSPFVPGADRLWISESIESKFGDFEAADLEKFLKVKESFRTDVAAVTGTPLYYFMQTGTEHPSGESMRKSETRFVNKVRDRMESFGQVWEELMAFALTIEKKGKHIRLFAEWQDPAPLTEKEQLDNLIIKKEIGVTDEQLLIEAGYGEVEVKKMLEQKAAEREALVKSFNAGDLDDDSEPGAASGQQ